MRREKVFSFSVFDTVLTRRTATPRGVFCLLGHQLRARPELNLPVQFIEEFLEIRTTAEYFARRMSGAEEITLDAIYARMGRRFPAIPPETIEAVKQAELRLEAELIIGIPEMIHHIHGLLDAGERVIFISDSYLPEDWVRGFLRAVDVRLADCPLYLSSTIKKTKASGQLFTHVLATEGIHRKTLTHRGCNPDADVKIPRSLGIRGALDRGALLSDLEFAYFEEDNSFSQLLAGVSKTFRIQHPDASPQAVMGACLAGPLFHGFVWDALSQARERGIRRLYFIARDGMVFLRIARAIVEACPMDLELRYLHGSRRAFRLPSVFEITPRERRWLGERIPALSLAMLAERLDMTGEELHALLPLPLRERIADVDHSMSESLADEVLDQLDRVPLIRDRIASNAGRARDETIAYLRQEGFFDDARVGTVDIGWMGGSQDSLYKIAASHKPDIEIHGFYFGLFHYSKYTTAHNSKTAYAILPNHTSDNIVALHTELLAQADHGQTIGYERRGDGLVVPRLRDDGEHLRDWGIGDFLDGVECFSREYMKVAKQYPRVSHHFISVIPSLFRLMKRPTRLIAETLGSVPYSGDHCDLRLRESAPAFDPRQAFSYAFSQRYENRRLMTEWYEATLVRSSPVARAILRLHPLAQSLKYTVKHSLLFVLNRFKDALALRGGDAKVRAASVVDPDVIDTQ